jgi:N-formylglutamate amidohydrolase
MTTRRTLPLVVHVPHASVEVPADLAADFVVTPATLAHELLVMTDRYTDELFAMPADAATTVTFPVSRLVLDPERFVDDALEVMAKKGMGVIYERTSDGRALRVRPSVELRARLLRRFYDPHHAALTDGVQAALDAHGTCLLLDAHSFSSSALPFELDQNPRRPDICVGTDPVHTPAWLRELAVREFEAQGWSVEVDRPFAGALVPSAFYRRDTRVMALMIEVNRRLYMDEGTGEKADVFEEVRQRLGAALQRVRAGAENVERP